MRFSGLMSQWTTPTPCINARAEEISKINRAASASEYAPSFDKWSKSSPPVIKSITK
eukprot:CAMPEP_0168238196 /NCGR_PEP_ID=MMETSP0140_2-20121125/20707_1 /TAXON_ID=44445 /ORGANISM="Pseudo-nitzschia australis, Strain 10249 10 AB" /LENGTH=56 /DNA_ID=CAMNT_0008172113 /DNA_START=27 /DNA_END=197 /DNA_ORIENTATION=+